MKSLRLGPQLAAKLSEAARVRGVTESAMMRQAIDNYCDAVLENRLYVLWAPHFGKVASEHASDASDAHREAARIATEEYTRQRDDFIKHYKARKKRSD